MDKKPTVDRRCGQRRTTRIEAVMQSGSKRSHVMILDYQDNGLQLWVRDLLMPDSEIILHVAKHVLRARVQWCEGKSAGVRLLQPLERDLQRMFDAAKDDLPDAS